MNNQINNGGPAFAIPFPSVAVPSLPVHCGMSLRDYFAAAALHGILSNTEASKTWNESDVARFCYFQADAMIKAREAKP